ncbi:SsrA-binding protein SmpB [Tepidicaulis sp. LMO-SS28]|uniref:SsrA-binding protein SmpB n=1 Tax=Tepidicaulis sp. LMO-SS28 TaxID=3447455 RepID=UPI003EDFAEDC
MSSKAGGAKKRKGEGGKIVADNRKARHNYFIKDTYEAGIMLTGTEVKSLRTGAASLGESYAQVKDGEVYLINAHIPEYLQANRFNHAPRRQRKLLLHAREITKLSDAVHKQGMTVVPLKLYFNDRGIAKVELGLAQGKKLVDKRQTEKDRSWQRDKARLLKERG